jgi:hypothetical protein
MVFCTGSFGFSNNKSQQRQGVKSDAKLFSDGRRRVLVWGEDDGLTTYSRRKHVEEPRKNSINGETLFGVYTSKIR